MAYTLIVDQGNTLYKAGWFLNNELRQVSTHASIESLLVEAEKYSPQQVGIGSVGKKSEETRKKLEVFKNVSVIDNSWATPLVNDYNTPKTLGIDRLAAAVGAYCMFPEENVLVVDMGSCITYDMINAEGQYLGGNISPGAEMRHKAMAAYTANLPNPGFSKDVQLIGKSTHEALQSGVFFGILGELEGMIGRYRHLFGQLRVCLTGGDATAFETKLKEPIFAVRNLVLIGLYTILRQHAE